MWVKAYRVLRIKLGNVTGGWDLRGGSGEQLGVIDADLPSEKSDRPLDCWKEVEQFKAEVAKVEQVSLSGTRPMSPDS
jgi:hypothetical protein